MAARDLGCPAQPRRSSPTRLRSAPRRRSISPPPARRCPPPSHTSGSILRGKGGQRSMTMGSFKQQADHMVGFWRPARSLPGI